MDKSTCVSLLLDDIISTIEKCGGPGGTPGPCALNKPGSNSKPSSSSSSSGKPKPAEKPKPKPKPAEAVKPPAPKPDPSTGAGALAAFLAQYAAPKPTAPAPTAKPAAAKPTPAKPAPPKPTEKPKPALSKPVPEKPKPKPSESEKPKTDSAGDRTSARKRTPDEITKEGKALLAGRKLSDPKKEITEEYGRDAVKAYTSDVYYATANKKLREGESVDKVPPSPEMSDLNHLAKQPLAQPTVTYRGISPELFASHYEKLGTGGEITAKGFVSTSLKPDVATEFAKSSGKNGVVLEIKAKTGLYVDDLSKFKGEHEIVQAHGTKYRMIGIDHDVPLGGTKSTVVRLEEI